MKKALSERKHHISDALDRISVFRTYRSGKLHGRVLCGDALRFLRDLRPGSADLVFLDPPFNLGKDYAHQFPNLDRRHACAYNGWLLAVLGETVRVLKPGGALYLYHLPVWAMRFGAFLDRYLEFRHWIAVSMKNGFVRGRRLYQAHYALLMFSKGDPKHFARPKLRPAICRHCGGYVKDYGGYRKIIEAKGINLSDVWEDLSPVRHEKRKHRSANELPSALFQRVLSISAKRGGVFVDPFAGTGSGIMAAALAGMRFEACDILQCNCELICERIASSELLKKRG